MKYIKCIKCNKKNTDTALCPIDPIGKKGRRYMCMDCLYSIPYPFSKWLDKRGQRISLKFSLRIKLDRLKDKLKQEKED